VIHPCSKKNTELYATGKCTYSAKNMCRLCRNVEMIVGRRERESKENESCTETNGNTRTS